MASGSALSFGPDHAKGAGQRPQRVGVDIQPVDLRHVEQADGVERVLLELAVVADVQPLAVQQEAFDILPGLRQPKQREARQALGLRLQVGAEDPGQVADILGDQEVVLHEALDPDQAGMVGIAQPPADIGLHVEGQTVLAPAGQVMQVAAHGQQEVLRLGELRDLFRQQHLLVQQLGDVIDLVVVLRDPEQRLKIAKAALAFLDVGLQHIAAVAQPAMAGVPLLQLRLDEGGAGAGDDLLGEAAAQLVEQLLLAMEEAGFQQAGADRHVGLGLPHAFVHRPDGMTDLQPQVPQDIEHVFEHLLHARRPLVGQHEQQVDVREGRHLPPAIAADGGDSEKLARGRVGGGINAAGRVIRQRPDHLIHQIGVLAHAVGAAAPRLEPPAHLRPPLLQRRAQGREDMGTQGRARAVLLDQCRQFGDQAALGDDGPPVGDGFGRCQHIDKTHSRSGRHRPTGSTRQDHTLFTAYMGSYR